MTAKELVKEELERKMPRLIDLSRRIHAAPETAFEEVQASRWLCDALEQAGFRVERGICGLPTAFRASRGDGPLHVAFCAEYDALPDVGHACGHNLIAAMSLGAALAAAAAAEEAGLTVTLLGTPAEEVGNAGGKILLLENGAFKGIHASLMAHPGPDDVLEPHVIACAAFEIHYHGRQAHAAAFPELGINAADAVTVAQTAIGLLRQHIPTTARIHGIITRGGEASNIVPGLTTALYDVRSETLDELQSLKPRVLKCFEAGALATGCRLEVLGGDKPYAHMEHDPGLTAAYRKNAESLGRVFVEPQDPFALAPISTDMGNISLALPSIHPMIGIDSLPAVNHQPEFASHCITPAAERAIGDGALALAWTAIDAGLDKDLRARLTAGGAEAGAGSTPAGV
jgi:amidohydrolase